MHHPSHDVVDLLRVAARIRIRLVAAAGEIDDPDDATDVEHARHEWVNLAKQAFGEELRAHRATT